MNEHVSELVTESNQANLERPNTAACDAEASALASL